MNIEQLTLDKNIKFHLAKLEKLPAGSPINMDDLDALKNNLHRAVVEYLNIFGRSTWSNGRLQTCHPSDLRSILALAFKADDDFNHNDFSAYAYSAFGQLYLWHTQYGLVELDLLTAEIEADGLKEFKDGKDISGQKNTYWLPFSSTTADTNNFYDENGEKLFDRCVEKLGPVGIGECFGFFPAIALGGAPNLENVKKVKAFEHFTFLAQLQTFKWIHIETYFDTGRLEKTIIRDIG